eukprot:GFYU01010472.1.p1 GENE.GFYU01010472.1~~GFYU01010472.1.p1  ORF type:complete len:219 (-),score=64.01 GFYU01010472.1:148-804(-)
MGGGGGGEESKSNFPFGIGAPPAAPFNTEPSNQGDDHTNISLNLSLPPHITTTAAMGNSVSHCDSNTPAPLSTTATATATTTTPATTSTPSFAGLIKPKSRQDNRGTHTTDTPTVTATPSVPLPAPSKLPAGSQPISFAGLIHKSGGRAPDSGKLALPNILATPPHPTTALTDNGILTPQPPMLLNENSFDGFGRATGGFFEGSLSGFGDLMSGASQH